MLFRQETNKLWANENHQPKVLKDPKRTNFKTSTGTGEKILLSDPKIYRTWVHAIFNLAS